MRHHFTSTAFAVKLLYISLISISLCAAQETEQQSVPDLIALLDDKDDRIVEMAAEALMKHGDRSAAPALTKAMKRVQDDDARWSVANALWHVAPNDPSAQAILNVARKQEGQSNRELFAIVDNPIGRRYMTETERLNFLLNYKLSMTVGYPEALDIHLDPQEEYDRELLWDKADRLFLEKRRAQVVDMMLAKLRDRGSQVAALLLGYFKEPKALPDLQKWFIETDNYYGWEGSWNELSYDCYPVHHCYEEAITHITGKPINAVIKLTDAQVTELVERYHRAQVGMDAQKLYVLFRLKQDIAREEAARKFRGATTAERFWLCMMMCDLLPKGVLLTEVRRLLGAPDRVQESSWFYDCGIDPLDRPHILTVTFDNDRLSQVSYQVSYKRARLED